MIVLSPNKFFGGRLRSVPYIKRLHLSLNGITSLCGRNLPNHKEVERPTNNKDICVTCLVEEMKLANPVEPKPSSITGIVYNFRSRRGRTFYTEHYLDDNKSPYCKRPISQLVTQVPEDGTIVQVCQRCAYILESRRAYEKTYETQDV